MSISIHRNTRTHDFLKASVDVIPECGGSTGDSRSFLFGADWMIFLCLFCLWIGYVLICLDAFNGV